MTEPSVYYFGCIRESGHYMWDQRGGRSFHDIPQPWGTSIDGRLAPAGDPWAKSGQPEGLALLHHKDGWTALSFWDRTVDRRPGSSSTFLVDRDMTFDELVTLAKEKFPKVWARFTFPVTEKEPVNG